MSFAPCRKKKELSVDGIILKKTFELRDKWVFIRQFPGKKLMRVNPPQASQERKPMPQQIKQKYRKATQMMNFFVRVIKILTTGGKLYLAAIVIFAIIFGIMPSISILVMQSLINTLQSGDMGFDHIAMLIAIYIGLDMFSGLVGFVSSYVENVLQMKAGITLKMSILEKTKEFSLKDFEDSETYNSIQRVINMNANQLFAFFKSFVLAFQSLITLIAFGAILISWRWWMLPVIFIMPVINSIVSTFFGKKQFLIQRNRAGKSRKQWYFQHLLTNDIAFKEIKVFGIGDYFRNRYRQIAVEFLGQDRKLLNQRTVAQSGITIIDQAISAVLFIYIVMQAFVGAILLGDLITFTRSISNIKSSTQGFLSQINSIYQNVLYIGQYFEFIDMKTGLNQSNVSSRQPLTEIPYIEIKNLTYRYKNKMNNALNGLSMRIDSNSLVAFIGQNGSGKTTLVKILSTLYNDYQGDVFFGNINLQDIDPADLQRKVGLLFQDHVKYELSTRENVALGHLEKIDDDDAVMNALIKTGMNERIANLETQLGVWFDDGVQLSGGEWLRVALSRAFIREASIYLLDEPNAALDSVSERQILKSFKELANGKIGIVVSHRITSIKNIVDKIIVFDNGTVQACGSHDELLRTSKVYQELYEKESGIDT